MGVNEDAEDIAAAIAAYAVGAKAHRRDIGGGNQIRDFDLIFSDDHIEPLEVTRHFDQAATETWERLSQADREAPTLSRAWTLDIPNKIRSPSGVARPYGVREFVRDVQPALRDLEKAGYERFDLGLGHRDRSIAQAVDTLTRLGVQFGLSHELLPGEVSQISAVAAVGGVTDPNSVADGIETEASDAGNQAKLRQPTDAPRRHLFVVFDPSSGSAYNAVDRGLLGRLPELPDPITTAWAFARHRVFVTTPPEGWQEYVVPPAVITHPDRWLVP